jgi:hypothetical protein
MYQYHTMSSFGKYLACGDSPVKSVANDFVPWHICIFGWSLYMRQDIRLTPIDINTALFAFDVILEIIIYASCWSLELSRIAAMCMFDLIGDTQVPVKPFVNKLCNACQVSLLSCNALFSNCSHFAFSKLYQYTTKSHNNWIMAFFSILKVH